MRILNQEQIIELLDFLVEQDLFGEHEIVYKGKMFFIKGGDKVDFPEETFISEDNHSANEEGVSEL